MLSLYNTLTLSKQGFLPRKKGTVTLYVCGITPYDTTHIGHAFTYIFFDVLIRYLTLLQYKVIYTQNVTDINDRDQDLLKRAKEQQITWQQLSRFWTDRFLQDMQTLNWIRPTNYLYASGQIEQIVTLIDLLLKNGFAYNIGGGIYLNIKKVKTYGALSRLTETEMLKQAKIFEEDLNNPDKQHPLDITLWKPKSTTDEAHIPSFNSPYGQGRPGWHIECSAISIYSLGKQIDIHGGGTDLIYPHHESEIAQSESATGKKPFAKYWVHTAPVFYKGEKMSKSLGNVVMVSNLVKKYTPNAIRYILLSNHHSKQWEFFENDLDKAQTAVNSIEKSLKKYRQADELKNIKLSAKFKQYMDDNINTPKVLEMINEMSKNTSMTNELGYFYSSLGFVLTV